MNAANYTYAFLAATALKQPFPAVSDTGVTTNEAMQTISGDITMTGKERARMVKSVLVVGAGMGIAASAVIYAVFSMARKKRRK